MEIDDSFQVFLDESLEALHDCEDGIAELGNEQENGAQVDLLFRNYHTIKGGAGMVGLHSLERMAHSIEDLLNKIRQGEIHVDDNIKKLLGESNDVLDGLIMRADRDKADHSLLPEEEDLINYIRSFDKGEYSLNNLLRSFLKDIKELISTQGNRIIEPETWQKITSRIEGLDRDYRNLITPNQEGGSIEINPGNGRWVIGQKDTTELVKLISRFFQGKNEYQVGDTEKPKEIVPQISKLAKIAEQDANNRLSSLIKEFKENFSAVITSPVGLDEMLFGIFKDDWSKILEQAEFHPNKDEQNQALIIETIVCRGQSGTSQENTLRIPESRLDKFLNQVAELIIMTGYSTNFGNQMEMVTDLSQLQSLSKKFILHANDMFKATLNLESSLKSIRKVQVKNITRKAQRQIRELAKKMKKKVSLEIEGDHIEVDKMIIEKLDDPLMHILRNCLDHGLESPVERVKCNKGETGKITILVKEEEKSFVLSVSDDGRGIDLEGVKAKAIANGLFSADQLEKMGPSEISQIIFQAGLSLAKEVTTISGRGVGMDVVRKNVEVLKGSIDVRTERFKGTSITISIPLKENLLVSKGILFRIGSSKLIIEAANLIEILSPDKFENVSIQNQYKMVKVRDVICPLIDFKIKSGEGRQTTNLNGNKPIFFLEANKGQVCLSADEVLGVQSFVLKEMNSFLKDVNIYKGTAILKDGSIGLVLDVDSIVDGYYIHGCN
ncbi:MAG: chemotaxis protein CheA [Deltaproteobacteria bacterium]|nr:chemotaxis protein CheA [Deltaproteobacteria bacterium]